MATALDPQMKVMLDAFNAAGPMFLRAETAEQARAKMRALLEANPIPAPAIYRVEDRHIPGVAGDITARIYTPEGSPQMGVLVFFHGGGFVVCTLETHDPYCRALAAEARVIVASVDYRLAPEHKFPAGVDDCLVATDWVLEHAGELGGDSRRVFVAGDSAGATLATVTALTLRDRGEAGRLAGQILLYPVAGYYDPPTVSYLEMAEGYGLTRKGMIWFWDHYLNDKGEAGDFRAAPLMASSLAGLPRAFVVTAEYDVLRDEGQAYARRMEADGVDVTHEFALGMNHGFAASPNEFPFLPQAKELLRRVAGWVAG